MSVTSDQQPGTEAPFVFNPYAPGFDANPFPTFRYLQEHAPVYFWNVAQAWVLTKHADVIEAMRDPRLSLDRQHWQHYQPTLFKPEHADYAMLLANGLWSVSRADHNRIRKLIAPAFSQRTVGQMQAQIQAVVDDAFRGLEGKDVIDVAHDFAEIVPMAVICKLLDIPTELIPAFRSFGYAFIEATSGWLTPEQFDQVVAPIPEGVRMLRELIANRRANPGPDLMSELIRARDEDSRLSEDELIALVSTLIAAGTETTGHVIAFAVLNLLRHPEQLALLRSDWSLLGSAIEECTRHNYFAKASVPRYATEDLEIRGTKIAKGQMVLALLTAALRDPEVFPNADVFDIRRDPRNNGSFGAGPHYCVGVHLGRVEAALALQKLFGSFGELRLEEEPSFAPHPFLRKIASLKLRVR